jgi:protein-S-isoprenylcysteine O-methyltransferase Ste14
MQALDLNPSLSYAEPGTVRRTAVLGYAVLAYNAGFLALLWLILTVGGLVPAGAGPLHVQSTAAALAVNVALITLFGLQHSVMARQSFKHRLMRYLPAAVERSTYILCSGACLALAVWLWQPLPGEIWSIGNGTLRLVLWGLFALGWGYLFAATFVTNHFELFGLRQAYLYFTGRPYTPLPFVRKYMYRYSRHPMMLGVLVGLWAVPVMSATHFILASLLTLYVAIGVLFEERDLARRFGDAYRSYRKEIAALIPGLV